MTGITDSSAFFFMWIGFLFLMIIGIACIFVWAIRTRQFSNQERARFLPLKSGIPKELEEQRGDRQKKVDES